MLTMIIFVLSVLKSEKLIFFLLLMTISDANPVQFWLSECATYNEQEPFGIHRRCFCAPWETDDEIKVQFTDDGTTEYDLVVFNEDDEEIHSEPFEISDTKYSASLLLDAISPDVSGKIQLKIIEVSSPEVIIAKSDCLEIGDHEGSVLIRYANPRNYAGLVYDETSPDTDFYLRVPAMFYHTRQVSEDEFLSLTNQIVMQNNEIKDQRLFTTDSLPEYFHKKIQLVLKHQTVEIDNMYWMKEEAYEQLETDRRNPLKKYSVWLTDKDSIQRNVL